MHTAFCRLDFGAEGADVPLAQGNALGIRPRARSALKVRKDPCAPSARKEKFAMDPTTQGVALG